jgi:hypothetical protein
VPVGAVFSAGVLISTGTKHSRITFDAFTPRARACSAMRAASSHDTRSVSQVVSFDCLLMWFTSPGLENKNGQRASYRSRWPSKHGVFASAAQFQS